MVRVVSRPLPKLLNQRTAIRLLSDHGWTQEAGGRHQVKMVKGTAASTVYVDAMTGEVVKDKKFGGVKAMVENAEESQKLIDAKKDSTAKKP